MGIKGLWNVFTPYSEKKSLHEIRGETVAVDLSGWVCDSQNVTEYHVQPKLYLRNLFFRTVYLMLADITPIFVLDGDAPELKQDVMASRNAIQFRGAAPRSVNSVSKRPDVGRRRFKNVLKECQSLLTSLGVRCITAEGEAEATCAQLNLQGLVHAVVSQDSDCFAYGAKRVYRNFSVSSSAGGGALQGSVDCYDADLMFTSNGFGRNKMVALALLCGCDYGAGACGSSINTVVSFLHTVPDTDIIPRLLSWVTDADSYQEKCRWASAPGRCDRCGHAGRAQSHARQGCAVCATHRGCSDLGHKSTVAAVKRELSLRSRAVSSGMVFPEPRVMQEFLSPAAADRVHLDRVRAPAPAPNLIHFVKIMSNKLEWSERYCVTKFLPILTRWHLQDDADVPLRTVHPVAIIKKRNPRGVPSYDVVWGDIDGQYEALIPDEQLEENEDPSVPWTSTERQDLMRKYFPDIVEAFEESKRKPIKEKKSKTKKKKENDNLEKPKRKYNKKTNKLVNDIDIEKLSDSMKAIDLEVNALGSDTKNSADLNTSKANVSVKVNTLKRKLKRNLNNKIKGQKTIESFIANKKRKSSNKLLESIRNSFANKSLRENVSDNVTHENLNTNKENERGSHHCLSMFNETDAGNDLSDLSDIVEKIVSRAAITQTTKVNNKVMKLVFDNKMFNSTPRKSLRKSILKEIQANCSTPNGSPIQKKDPRYSVNLSNNMSNPKVNFSYFFEKLSEERDAFELSLELNSVHCKRNSDMEECDKTVEYSLPSDSLPDVCL